MVKHIARALVPGCLLVAPLAAQRPTDLTQPQAAFDEPFTMISGVRELNDGRVLVSDSRDKVVLLVDLAQGTSAGVGREGQGPGEYSMPSGLIPLPGGETLVQDLLSQRFLSIGAGGEVGKLVTAPRPPSAAAGPGGTAIRGFSFVNPRGVDGQGRLYFQGTALPRADGTAPDSVPLLRWARTDDAVDTVGWVQLPESQRPRVTRSGGGVQVRIGAGMVWAPQIGWGVAADGRIAIVSPDPYQVTWRTTRGITVGRVVPYTPIKVTDAEKKAYKEAQARRPPMMIAMTAGGSGGTRAMQLRPEDMPEPLFPETMPPFTGQGAVLVTPEGEVWVQRTRKASDNTPQYDVFDGSGNLARRVSLQPKSRVVAFGKGTVYVARMDQDDLEYLERFSR